MLDNKIIQLIEETSEILNLENAVIEKDYYVTQIIHTLSHVENEYFQLIFCGGTCLAKAHKIVKRMSEDIDFKVQIKNNAKLSRSKLVKELKEFRSQIKKSIALPNFTIGNYVVRNEGKYQRVELNYPTIFSANTVLRPHMLLEFTLSEIRLPIEKLMVKTIIENTLEKIILFLPPETSCISINETAIEKWVGLTRRVVAIERKYHEDDDTLIRHVYDLNAIQKENKITNDFFTLSKSIIAQDAEQFKNQHPEYFENPSAEILISLNLLQNDIWQTRYQKFIETMVYDETSVEKYDMALANLEKLHFGVYTFH